MANKFTKPTAKSLEDFIGGAPSVSGGTQVQPAPEPAAQETVAATLAEPTETQTDNAEQAEARQPRKYKTKARMKLELAEKAGLELVSTKYVIGSKQKEALRKLSFDQRISASLLVRNALDDWFEKHNINLDEYVGAES